MAIMKAAERVIAELQRRGAPYAAQMKPTRLGAQSVHLFQSEESGQSLRLYVIATPSGPQVAFNAFFLDEGRRPGPLPVDDFDRIEVRWMHLCEQHKLSTDRDYLIQRLREVGMHGAVGAVAQLQAFEARANAEREETTKREWSREELAGLLQRTADRVLAHRGGLVVHTATEVCGSGSIIGCSVMISGYLGG